MIEFEYQVGEATPKAELSKEWLRNVALSESAEIVSLVYVFCSDAYLLELNQQFLKHDTYTDVICFDDSQGKSIQAEVYISVDRVEENAAVYKVSLTDELHRVMAHALLHCLGYKDKSTKDATVMRHKEDKALELRPAELIN